MGGLNLAYMETFDSIDRPATVGVTSESFRDAMRELASGVALVTSGMGEERSGCTVTALASLCLSPPALLVCLNQNSATLQMLRRRGVFAVNLLGSAHEALAARFSGSGGAAGAERFGLGSWRTLTTGAPILADALAAIDCRLDSITEHGTHAIVIGSAEAILQGDSGAALLHWRRRFERVG